MDTESKSTRLLSEGSEEQQQKIRVAIRLNTCAFNVTDQRRFAEYYDSILRCYLNSLLLLLTYCHAVMLTSLRQNMDY